MLQNLSVQFTTITRDAFFLVRLQTETCSVVLGIFRECGTVFYRVRYGAVRCIHLVIPVKYSTALTVVTIYTTRCHDLPKRTETDQNGPLKIPKRTSMGTETDRNGLQWVSHTMRQQTQDIVSLVSIGSLIFF